jgi:ferric-dicitrate binding protein FerR (iron transport regulator)
MSDSGEVFMKLKKTFVFALSLLILWLPVAPLSATSPASERLSGQMVTIGTAEINGVAAPATTSIFAGDRVATEKETSTSISLAGGDAVVISELSKAALDEFDGRTIVRLEQGTVSALNKSAKPMVVEADGARIQVAPNQSGGYYEVALRGNSLRVIARGGVTRVETANKTADVQPGTELDATLVPPQPPVPPAPPSVGGGLSSASTWVLIAAVAAGATGLVLGAIALHKVDSCKLSPSKNSIVC